MNSQGLLYNVDAEALRARSTQAPYSKLWRRLVARWEGIAARDDFKRGELRQGNLGWPGITPRIIDAALVRLIEGRKDALAHVLACANMMIDRYAEVHSQEQMRAFKWQNWRAFVLSHSELALAADLVRDDLPPVTQTAINRLMRECIIGFHNFESALAGYASGTNILCCQNINAGIAALVWGEECGYPGWQDVVWKASETVRQYLRHGCDADGFSYEGTGYGHSMFIYVYLYAQLLKQRGVRDLFAEEPVLEKIPDASQHMLLDNHAFAATTNDHGTFEPWSMWWLPLTAKYYNRPDHMGLWHAFQGPENPIRPYGDAWPWFAKQTGAVPNHTLEEKPDPSLFSAFLWWDADAPVKHIKDSPLPLSQCALGTGTATFRNTWKDEGIFAIFLGAGRSHTCAWHAHLDCGHFGISAYGQYLAVDTGRYNFTENQHNVVLIEGRERHRDLQPGAGMGCDMTEGRLCDFTRGSFVSYCRADAAQMKNCRWADRHFLFVNTTDSDAYVVTLDNINVGEGAEHAFRWQLQAHPQAKISITGERRAVISNEAARLDISFFMKENIFSPDEENPFLLSRDVQECVWPYGKETWADDRRQDMEQIERLDLLFTSIRRPRLSAVQKSAACFLGAVISPRRAGAPELAVESWSKDNLMGVTIKGKDFTDTLIAALDHAYIDTPEYYGLCELAIVRRDTGGNIISIWTKGGELKAK